MAEGVTVRINSTEFDRALRAYAALTKRTPAEIVNRKSYFINRRAIWNTRKANISEIKKLRERRIIGTGIRKGKRVTIRDPLSTTRAALIIQARLRKSGKKLLTKDELPAAVKKFIGARLRSIAFLKSGFIRARDGFKAWCQANGVSIGGRGLPPNESERVGGPKQIGRPKGGFVAASPVWRAKATFFNAAAAKHDKSDSLSKIAGGGLAQGFADETADTISEIERRLRQHAHSVGIKTS
jgi:hypothetical protein